jgi:putative DNA primase/helicase
VAIGKLGFVASTNAMGAGNWRDEYSPWFAGKRVVVVPDNDDLGREHARKVARSLFGIAEWVKILELPGLPHKGDISDWLKPGHTKEETIEHEGRVN